MNEYKIGCVFGKFMPLHNGHVNFINIAATKVDKLYVVLSYDSKALDTMPLNLSKKLSLRNRFIWLQQTFKDFDHIVVTYIDESNIPSYPNGWSKWTELLKDKISSYGDEIDVFFTSEPEYDDNLKKYFPNSTHEIIDEERDEINISATMIREDVYKHWSYLPSIVRKEFVYKVCVIGLESTGKSTLTKYLSKRYNTSWTPEYGRIFVENNLFKHEELLSKKDYDTIVTEHYRQIDIDSKTANKILFVDTDAVITQTFYNLQFNSDSKIVDYYINNPDYCFDMYLFLTDDVEYVDDGVRLYGSEEKRNKASDTLKNNIKKYGIDTKNFHVISGNYEERLREAITIINNTGIV